MTTALEKLILANKINFNKLMSYKYLSLDFILERNYDPKLLSNHSDITINYILENPHINWDFSWINSMNKSITLDDIIEHSELPWDYSQLSFNPNITIEFILNNKDKNWDWDYISDCMATDLAVQMYPTEPWNFEYLTQNLNVSFEFIKQNPQYKWDYNNIPLRGDIPLEELEKYNPDKNKMYNKYSDQLLKKYPFYLLDHISLFHHMDLGNFDKLPYIGDLYYYNSVSHNPTLTIEFMRKHKNINYDLKNILDHNEHMTCDVILESDDEFHWTAHEGIYRYYGCRAE